MSELGKRTRAEEQGSNKRKSLEKEKTIYPEKCELGGVTFFGKLALNTDYRNERKAMRFFSRNEPSKNRYLSSESQNNYRVQLDKNPMCFPDGNVLHGKYNFCLTCEESPRLLCSQNHHHSFLANGKKVLGMGTLTFDEGQLIEITNNSGHYKPTNEQMLDVIKALHYESESSLKTYVSYSHSPREVFAVSAIIEAESFSLLKPLKKNQIINQDTGEVEKIKLNDYDTFDLKDKNVNNNDELINNNTLKLKEELQEEYDEIVRTHKL
jgi:hypothetical protein